MNIEPIRFSWLRNFARSPAHAKAELESPRLASREMDLGSIGHRLVLGPRESDGELAIWAGKVRRGKAWDAFAKENSGKTIVLARDFHAAKRMAEAVRADETAADVLRGAIYEKPLTWIESGFQCETRGVDIFTPGGTGGVEGFVIAELKFTTNVEPAKLQRHAMTMLWPQQLEWYRGGHELKGFGECRGAYIIAVEVTRPHVVTVLELGPDVLGWARKSLTLWLERCRVCLADDHWPGYEQRVVAFELPPWLAEAPDGGDEEEDGESGAAA